MTNDEVERAIEILLNNQANFDVRLEKTNEQLAQLIEHSARTDQRLDLLGQRVDQTSRQLAETNMRLEAYAETQTQFIQVVMRHIEAQGEINASLRGAVRELTDALRGAVRELTDAQLRTDERLNALIDIVREGRNGKS
jgi:uncharacterized membrane-anchored protein YhcB (DUF1043 family)